MEDENVTEGEEVTEDEEVPETINDVMRDIEPNRFLTSSTTILDAVGVFTKTGNSFFYVIDVNKVIGVLSYEDLFRPIGRIAFLTLALEIEDLALRLCLSPKFKNTCWLSISDNRKQLSLGFFKQRYSRKPKLTKALRKTIQNLDIRDLTEEIEEGKEWWADATGQLDTHRLIACTQLVDKATMIWKKQLITGKSKTDLLGFFDELRSVRDSCAHPGHDDPILAQDRLADFVASAMRMRKSFQEAIENTSQLQRGPQQQ